MEPDFETDTYSRWVQDQYRAAEADTAASADRMATLLAPEGIAAETRAPLDLESFESQGPVTRALATWTLNEPHPPVCVHLQQGPAPMFALIDSPHDCFCLGCFIPRWDAHRVDRAGRCDVCRYAVQDVLPVMAQVSAYTVALLICEDCRDDELNVSRRRSLNERWLATVARETSARPVRGTVS